MLHFFDVTLRNSTGKICKHDCRGAAVLARDRRACPTGWRATPAIGPSPPVAAVPRRRRCLARRRRGNIRFTVECLLCYPAASALTHLERNNDDFREKEEKPEVRGSITVDFERRLIQSTRRNCLAAEFLCNSLSLIQSFHSLNGKQLITFTLRKCKRDIA